MTPNKKSRQWVVLERTTHCRDFCRVLYLLPSFAKLPPPSDKKLLFIACFAKLPYRTP